MLTRRSIFGGAAAAAAVATTLPAAAGGQGAAGIGARLFRAIGLSGPSLEADAYACRPVTGRAAFGAASGGWLAPHDKRSPADLDPDIAAHRSWSWGYRVRLQRERDNARMRLAWEAANTRVGEG